jgi:hypothetical protein
MAPVDIPADDYSLMAAAARQLHPTMRETFATRVHAALQDIHEPGPGDRPRGAGGVERELGSPVARAVTLPDARSRRRREALIKIPVSAGLLRSESYSRALPDPIVLAGVRTGGAIGS